MHCFFSAVKWARIEVVHLCAAHLCGPLALELKLLGSLRESQAYCGATRLIPLVPATVSVVPVRSLRAVGFLLSPI